MTGGAELQVLLANSNPNPKFHSYARPTFFGSMPTNSCLVLSVICVISVTVYTVLLVPCSTGNQGPLLLSVTVWASYLYPSYSMGIPTP